MIIEPISIATKGYVSDSLDLSIATLGYVVIEAEDDTEENGIYKNPYKPLYKSLYSSKYI